MSNCTFAPGADGIRPIKYSNGVMSLIDQRLLPGEEVWLEYNDYQAVAEAIRSMVVRGAPAIGVTAAYGAYFGARAIEADNYNEFVNEFKKVCDVLAATRPTAVNLCWALERMQSLIRANPDQPVENLKIGLEYEAMAINDEDIRINMSMGRHGAELLPGEARILTHCNAGALATAAERRLRERPSRRFRPSKMPTSACCTAFAISLRTCCSSSPETPSARTICCKACRTYSRSEDV